MVLLLLTARASLTLFFDSEMDDKLCCIVLISLFARLFARLSVRLSARLSGRLSARLSICLSVRLSARPSVRLIGYILPGTPVGTY